MIQIIPSIAILDGKVVRLESGDYDSEKVYDKDPVELARTFEGHGIEVIHLVDLDGAKRGQSLNFHILETIAGHTNLKVDFTGGIHTDGDISKAYEYGATYITAASVAVNSPSLFASWIVSYGREKITLGADCLNHKVYYRGWLKKSEIDVMDHIEYFYNRGLKYVKSTDISRDGKLEGPSFELYKEMQDRFPGIQVLASGGVRSMDDIIKLDEMGAFAVIVGKALYEGNISLGDIESFLVKPS